jgi:excisionase family DNA binding protein
METYLTIEGLAGHLKLSEQTIRRYVLNREIPYHKIKKVIRFRLSEIETWIDRGGDRGYFDFPANKNEGDLFAEVEAYCPSTAGSSGVCSANFGKTKETGEDIKASEPAGGAA